MAPGQLQRVAQPQPLVQSRDRRLRPEDLPQLGAASCVPFPGNIIPTTRLSPNGVAIMSAYPQPTPGYLVGTQNWVAQAAHPYNQRKGTLNIDILATDKQRISGRRSEAPTSSTSRSTRDPAKPENTSTARTRRTPCPGSGRSARRWSTRRAQPSASTTSTSR